MLTALSLEFHKKKVRYALTGGLAVSVLGRLRSTLDVDLLVRRNDLMKVHRILRRLGFRRTHRTRNVSRYQGGRTRRGVVDLLHAFRPHSMAMLKRAKRRQLSGLGITLPILQVEDVIGLKIQAIANDSSRKAGDEADIEALARANRKQLNWRRIMEYYEIFNMTRDGLDLRRKVRR